MTLHHTVEITFTPGDFPTYSVTCTAPDTAWCRNHPTCDCESYHRPDCAKPTELDPGCQYRDWFETYSIPETGEGILVIHIDTEWTGEDFIWFPKDVELR